MESNQYDPYRVQSDEQSFRTQTVEVTPAKAAPVYGNNRNRYDLIREALALLLAEPCSKTRLMYGVRLSYTQLQMLIPELERYGLVIKEDGRYEITVKGGVVLTALEKVKELMS